MDAQQLAASMAPSVPTARAASSRIGRRYRKVPQHSADTPAEAVQWLVTLRQPPASLEKE